MRATGLGVILIMGALASSARADELGEARQHYQNAQRAAELGEYDVAVREYAAAFHYQDDPAFLYDLGQVHRLAGHVSEAVRFYRMYLIKAPDAPNRAEVLGKLEALQRERAAQAERQRSTATVTPPPAPSHAASAPAEPAPPPS